MHAHVWERLACFCLEAELLFDEAMRFSSGAVSTKLFCETYSAAVWELSDACDVLVERGLEDMLDDCESAMAAEQRATVLIPGICN